jgi:hypothetical protein
MSMKCEETDLEGRALRDRYAVIAFASPRIAASRSSALQMEVVVLEGRALRDRYAVIAFASLQIAASQSSALQRIYGVALSNRRRQ